MCNGDQMGRVSHMMCHVFLLTSGWFVRRIFAVVCGLVELVESANQRTK